MHLLVLRAETGGVCAARPRQITTSPACPQRSACVLPPTRFPSYASRKCYRSARTLHTAKTRFPRRWFWGAPAAAFQPPCRAANTLPCHCRGAGPALRATNRRRLDPMRSLRTCSGIPIASSSEEHGEASTCTCAREPEILEILIISNWPEAKSYGARGYIHQALVQRSSFSMVLGSNSLRLPKLVGLRRSLARRRVRHRTKALE